jgi:MauM/NapG family ferredoxin protein
VSEAGPGPAGVPPPTLMISRTRGRLRRIAQIALFALFVFLLLGTRQEMKTGLPHDGFFLADPLVGLAAMTAGRGWILPMAIGGLAVLAATLVLGRAWCGWVCPLGSVLDWIPAHRPRDNERDLAGFWRQGKQLVLFLVIFGALLGSLTLIALDPLTIMFRSLAAGVLPLLNVLLLTVDTWLYQFSALQSPVGWFDGSVRAVLLGVQEFYPPNLTLLGFAGGVLALNVVRRRFWCRHLCPLGALLGLVSRLSLFRHRVHAEACISCGRCAARCPVQAIDAGRGFAADRGECTACLDCVENCPTHAISYAPGRPFDPAYQPERRHFFRTAGLAAVGAFVIAFVPTPHRRKQTLIRPPGATEDTLAAMCLRCGECVRVCPTGSIQPAADAAGWDGTWSPHLVMRHGYCDYSCNACGQVCPTGAIVPLALGRKRTEVIGVAIINRKTCIPFDEDRECIVCEEMCPLPDKAVVLKTEPGRRAARPYVLPDLCTGCGICEEQCPVNGAAAIRVMPPGTKVPEQDGTAPGRG